MNNHHKSVYAAFDPYPSYKGSAVHIENVTGILARKFPDTLLLTLPGHVDKELYKYLDHQTPVLEITNYLERGLAFSAWVDKVLDGAYNLQVGHFRDIWGGMPILKRRHITSVFEVNGLPSIELTSRYGHVTERTLEKFRVMEDACLENSDVILCPSETIKKHLLKRGVMGGKIQVIPNGADLPLSYPRPKDLPEPYFVYFGALQPWQGVDVLLKSLAYLRDKDDLKLVICSSHKPKFSRPYERLARKLGMEGQVIWKHQLNKEMLQQVVQHAVCTVAPLTECSRNLEQGCSPLKIFESMACKTPVVASDLPVVREILNPDLDGKLFRPDRPAELARYVRLLVDYPELGEQLAQHAFQTFKNRFTWQKINYRLGSFYDRLYASAYSIT